MLLRLVPKVFFDSLDEGLDLFAGGLGFALTYRDDSLAVVEREGAKAMIVADPVYAAKDRPEIAVETDAIETLRREIGARRPDLLHPNLPDVTMRPWGALEFALLDRTGVCIVLRQWPARTAEV